MVHVIPALFEWLVVGGAAWVVVEGASVKPGDRSSPAHRCVPVGGRTARFCAEGVLRQHWVEEERRALFEVVTVRRLIVRRPRGPWQRFQSWRAARHARRFVFKSGDPSRCVVGMEQWRPIEVP